VSFTDNFYNLLFEISSEDRHRLLLFLVDESANLTTISRNIGLNLPETRRHVTRLTEVDLIKRNSDSSYELTNFGKIVLEQIDEIAFFMNHKDYFQTHNVNKIPGEFKKRLGELSSSELETNILNYIRKMEKVLREANEEVLLLVDQFPLNHLPLIVDALERGVRVKIIEPTNRLLNPDLEAISPEETIALDRMRIIPLLEQKMRDQINLFMYLSENNCVMAFPTNDGKNDFIGFTSKDGKSLKWSRDLFQHYWDMSAFRIPRSLSQVEQLTPIPLEARTNQITVVGKERPEYDALALQDAVDNFSEVKLKGRFNLGTAMITLKRSVHIIGDGRTGDVPDTKIAKKGWNFPFLEQDFMFSIRGKNIDVNIENIHIENFNGTCIGSVQGNSIIFRKNRLTLNSGLGRGLTFGNWGDHVVGFTAGGGINIKDGGFPGGILIEDNYLDFALSYARGGFITSDGREGDPSYRPDLRGHQAPVCVGLNIRCNLGKVVIRNNVIRNMNSRGILVADNQGSAEIEIYDNQIVSEVFGAYPYNSPLAGVGIFIQSAWTEPVSGGKIEVHDNRISCEKVNYCGIAIHGPAMYAEGAGKLDECIIRDNKIELRDGYIGVQVRRGDSVLVENNQIAGKVYYGFQISGSRDRDGIDLTSHENIVRGNDLTHLVIKEPDDYSNDNVNGYAFTGENGKSKPAHLWLSPYTSHNVIQLESDLVIIDEGSDNQITR
jgi:predicted transcriptional regulator